MDHDKIYSEEWFKKKADEDARTKALLLAQSVDHLLVDPRDPKTVLDLGCGPGNHVRSFNQIGYRCVGVDASKHSKTFLNGNIDFVQADLGKGLWLEQKEKPTITLCMEVAEHIEKEYELNVIDNICRHTGKWLIFTAAKPNQGGTCHVNEAPKDHWKQLIIRKADSGLEYDHEMTEKVSSLWESTGIEWWYWRNVMIFKRVKPRLKFAMIYAFHNQHREFEIVYHNIKQQQFHADEYYLSIDHSTQEIPACIMDGEIPFEVTRSDPKNDGTYTRGDLLNRTLAKSSADRVILSDSDCVPGKGHIRIYRMIYEGFLASWPYKGYTAPSEHVPKLHEGVCTVRPEELEQSIFVGPRWFIPPAHKIQAEPYGELKKLSSCSWKGHRGYPGGNAYIMGCNMAFSKRAWDLVKFQVYPKDEDARWWRQLEKLDKRWHPKPTPDGAAVLHMGPTMKGQYY